MPADVRLGQAFISYVYRILASNPEVWAKTLFIITYDEHGSFYDHVPPPTVGDDDPNFRQLGFRVPTLVIGPTVRQGHIESTQYDHVSVISTLTRRFGLRALNQRVIDTNDLSDLIDPELIDDPQPAADTQAVEISESQAIESFERVQFHGDKELARLADKGDIPRELDHRKEGRQQLDWLLELGEQYGAIKIKR
jgi:phospholipase C